MKPLRFSILTILLATTAIAAVCAILKHIDNTSSMNLVLVLVGLLACTLLGTIVLPIAIIAASGISPRETLNGVASPHQGVRLLMSLLIVDVAVFFFALTVLLWLGFQR